MVILISFDEPVGVDLEYVRPVPYFKKIAQRFFSTEDIKEMNNSLQRFFELWTKKEAFIKLKGNHIFDTEFKERQPAHYIPLSIPGYAGHACALQSQNHELQTAQVPHEYETNESSSKK